MRLSRLVRQLRPPVQARHIEPSFILSADDSPGKPNDFLIDLALRAVALARNADLDDIAARDPETGRWIKTWPGEHYRLLGGIVRALNPKSIIEIGTATGASALSMARFMAEDARLHTFDVAPWRKYRDAIFRDDDFRDARLVQIVDDLTSEDGFARHAGLVRSADLIFMDAAKDGAMEQRFLDNVSRATPAKRIILVLDDIRLYNMLAIWRRISWPKLDLTSFGHWSGTGLTCIEKAA